MEQSGPVPPTENPKAHFESPASLGQTSTLTEAQYPRRDDEIHWVSSTQHRRLAQNLNSMWAQHLSEMLDHLPIKPPKGDLDLQVGTVPQGNLTFGTMGRADCQFAGPGNSPW